MVELLCQQRVPGGGCEVRSVIGDMLVPLPDLPNTVAAELVLHLRPVV